MAGNGKGGRPPALTAEVAAAILSAIEKGCTRKSAAALADVSERSLARWLAKGRADKSGRYWQFCHQIKASEFKAAAAFEQTITLAALPHDEVTVKETIILVDAKDGEGKEVQLPAVKREVVTKQNVVDVSACQWWLERRIPDPYASIAKELREMQKRLDRIEKGGHEPD